MLDPLKKILKPIQDLQNVRGVALPIGLEFLQLIVTGPPGSGKSYYIEQIGGWPNEGYIDLTQKGWWKNKSLVYRPREVHLGLPFKGFKEALTVFDKEVVENPEPLVLELNRIVVPPAKDAFLQSDWRTRFIFEFLIPDPATIFERRMARQVEGYFPVDENLTLEMVTQQVTYYREIALYLHRAGLNVYLRKDLQSPPMWISERGVAKVPRWTLSNKPRRPTLKTLTGWKYLLRSHSTIKWLTLSDELQEIYEPCRIAHDGRSFELLAGKIRLRFQPEIALGVKKRAAKKNWIINTEQGCSTRNINGFMRILVGETIVIGRLNKDYENLFHFDDSVAKRHLSITNRKGDLILTPLTFDKTTAIVRVDDSDYRGRLARERRKSILNIRTIYGQDIECLPRGRALKSIRQVNRLLQNEPCRPKTQLGAPGGIVELTKDTTPVFIGDLHAQVDNLLKILSENCLLDCMRMKTATLIILGDAVHAETSGEMEDFETSMLIMDLIFMLKLRFPENLFYIRGNHDSFDPEISKNNFLQGELFKEALLQQRGKDYVEEMQRFYDNLPYLIVAGDFVACHGGPPRMDTTRKDLIEIGSNPRLQKELTCNRINRPNNLAGYTRKDVKRFRHRLGIPAKARFIVSHTPLDPFGSYWLHAGTIKNHHIIYSAHADGPCAIIRTDSGFMPITFPAEPLTDFINNIK
ncbi:metallophosphoesterase [Desulforhopalus singaporensis]|uniref:Calcineurin-like phosphoesterase n=1 Tax=Desulforhopalus singaporensis TaxID=91360 RepID=A0A1H0J8N6_9BACT|nr:metallophosphoesterase [Desulforhopalus singaporensis]SDO39863.1 Calcineurin-like phosphoesterase [Desulforhopalus singaporensis]